ncbi:hypothetical protein NL676_002202 [Syzygium grande]|nr:hypothetical protein NL676_002202 [Syzygium grande]
MPALKDTLRRGILCYWVEAWPSVRATFVVGAPASLPGPKTCEEVSELQAFSMAKDDPPETYSEQSSTVSSSVLFDPKH